MRLGVYVDAVYRRDGDRVTTVDEAIPFLTFAGEVGRGFDGLVFIGREAPAEADVATDHALADGSSLAGLPYYENLARLSSVVRAIGSTARGLWRAAGQVDVVWAFGPHPFSLLLAVMALVRRRRVVLGVRQDTMRYYRSRLRSRRHAVLLGPLAMVDAAWRLLGRRVPVTVVGEELEHRYGGPRDGVDAMTVSLVRSTDVVAAPAVRDGAGPVRLLSVGRIDQEKNPLLLAEVLAELDRAEPGRWHAEWVGTGPLAGALRERAEELGVSHRVDLPGFVPPGPELLERYRRADLFVHIAVTEGVPQVLLEALSSGTPVVATAVGGVPRALERGEAGVLVPPHDPDAMVRAIRDAMADADGRRERAARGLDLARVRALDAEAARVAQWIRSRTGAA